MNYRYFLLLSFISIIACNNPSSSTTSTDENEVTSDIIAKVEKDTSIEDMADWTVDDFIIKKPEGFDDPEIEIVMNQTIEHWKDAENPLTLTYKGVEMHDYYYINFEDQKNKNHYDFGTGDNNFKDYELIDSGDETNKKYLDKTFKVTWDWKKSYFPCCSGGGNLIEAYQPSIVKLELIEAGK